MPLDLADRTDFENAGRGLVDRFRPCRVPITLMELPETPDETFAVVTS